MGKHSNEQGSNGATTPEKPGFSLLERLDQLQWHLDGIEMDDVDRFEIDYFLGSLLQEAMSAAGKKTRKKWMAKSLKKMGVFGWKRVTKSLLGGTLAKKKGQNSPVLPLVIFVPSSDSLAEKMTSDAMTTTDTVSATSKDDSDFLYYLQDESYMSKTPSFFETMKEDGKSNRKHKRTSTAETVRMDSSMDLDLFEKMNDDCFFDLETGIGEI